MVERIPSIVVFGITGSGKSTLSNTLIGSENAFKESDEVESQTMETKGITGIFDNQPTFVIDTPGIHDTSGLDTPHLVEMAQYIKSHKEVQAFVIVISYFNKRLDEGIKRLFQLVSNMYPNKKWYHNIAVVWSFYLSNFNQKIVEQEPKREGFKRFIKKYIVPNISDDELNNIPQYFIDSIEAREEGNRSREELKHLIAWVSQLNTLQYNFGEIQEVNAEVKSREEELKTEVINEKIILNIKTITKASFQREKLTMYNGEISYTDWTEIPGSRNEIKETLPIAPVGKPTIEKRNRIENEETRRNVTGKRDVGNRKYVIFGPRKKVEYGHYLTITHTIYEERTCQPMNDGTIKYGEWIEKSRTTKRKIVNFGV